MNMPIQQGNKELEKTRLLKQLKGILHENESWCTISIATNNQESKQCSYNFQYVTIMKQCPKKYFKIYLHAHDLFVHEIEQIVI